MALNPNLLAAQLISLSKEDLTPDESQLKFAILISDFVKTATVTVNVTGAGNMGAPVQSTGTGQIS